MKAPFGIQHPSQYIPTEIFTKEQLLQCQSNEIALELAFRYLHSPQVWLLAYNEASNNPPLRRVLRCLIQMQTINACLRGRYFLPDGSHRNLDKKTMLKAASGTVKYSGDHTVGGSTTNKLDSAQQSCNIDSQSKTEYMVINGDSLDTAFYLIDTLRLNPVVLNMASMSHPGGGYLSGASAQEENLFRRTNLFQCMHDPYNTVPNRNWSYPLPEFGGLYIPNATVFRGSERNGYPFLNEPRQLSFVAVAGTRMASELISEYCISDACNAAYKDPPVETRGGQLYIQGNLVNHIKRKMSAIISIALENKHDAIVLGAWGCGSYENPPNHIAALFKEVLNTDKFKNRFKVVAFAILDDKIFKEHNPAGNLKPFAQIFNVEPIELGLKPTEDD